MIKGMIKAKAKVRKSNHKHIFNDHPSPMYATIAAQSPNTISSENPIILLNAKSLRSITASS